MSHWFHRNPIKATAAIDFSKYCCPSSSDSHDICKLLKETRAKLLDIFSDPSQAIEHAQQELHLYVSLLYGLYVDLSETKSGDSKLRYAIKFKWSQSLNPSNVQEEQDVIFEFKSILFNAALWYTKHAAYIAALTSEPSEKDAKEVHMSLKIASGIYQFIQQFQFSQSVPSSSKVEQYFDLNEAILNSYLNQCKAEAQEITIARAIELKHSPNLIASLANDTSQLFHSAAESLKGLDEAVVAKWKLYLELKSHFYKAKTYCYYALELLSRDKCGDAIKSLKKSSELYEETQQLCQQYAKTKGVGTLAVPERHAFFINLGKIISRSQEKCVRENTMIYHQKEALEVPTPEFKNVQGLVNPIEFTLPNTHALWSKQTYNSFDISKRIEKDLKKSEKNVEQPKEIPIPQGDADPKTESGCAIS